MTEIRRHVLIACSDCGHRDVWGPDRVVRALVAARKIRQTTDPDWDVIYELFSVFGSQLPCPECGETGLAIGGATSADYDSEHDDAWPEARLCARCRAPIPPERLAARPDATHCVACQTAEDQGLAPTPGQLEYCPRCGAPMQLRATSSGGIIRYAMVCTGQPPCRL